MEAFIDKSSSAQTDPVLNDEQLIRLCQTNDARAQQTLYERYVHKMYHVCFRYLGDSQESEDAVTDGFVKVFSKIDTFEYRGKGSLDGWVKRIMINESLMLLRKRKTIQVDIDQILEIETDQLSDAQLHEMEIMKLVYQLPKGYRTVFNLYVIEGYSHKEIAEKLGISENTSKSQLSKARASLVKTIQKNAIL